MRPTGLGFTITAASAILPRRPGYEVALLILPREAAKGTTLRSKVAEGASASQLAAALQAPSTTLRSFRELRGALSTAQCRE
jgi:hypothetical protein